MARRTRGKPVASHLRNQNVGETSESTGPKSEGDDASVSFRDWSVPSLKQTIAMDLFRESPALVIPCAEFVFQRGLGKRPATRPSYVKNLRYLSRYISAYGSSYGIGIYEYSDFSTSFMDGFLQWLNGKGDVVPRVNKAGKLAGLTRASAYNLARDLLEWVKSDKRYSNLAPQDIVFQDNASAKAYLEIQPRKGLSAASVAAIRAACFKELSVTFDMLERGASFIADDTVVVPDLKATAPAFKDLAVCMKAYHSTQQLGLTVGGFKKAFPGLHRALNGSPYHSIGKILPYLHFTLRTVLPVVLLLQMHFSYEPDTLVLLDWEGETDSLLFGPSRGVVTGKKYRGGFSLKSKPYNRSDKRRFSPAGLFRTLRLVTPKTAKLISPTCNKIFCFSIRNGDLRVFTGAHDLALPLRAFCKTHRLPHFTLSNLRKTGADIVGEISGGDLAEQKAYLLHDTVNTTLRSYQSGNDLVRRQEQIGHAQNIRARRIACNGKIETRGASLSLRQRLAATIGFYCLDAYDSPHLDQQKGQLCRAYGRCPACPLAQINRKSASDCGRLMQVRKRILEARKMVDPSRWRIHWAPQLEALEKIWLPAFSTTTRSKANNLVLTPIPEVE